MKEKIFIPDFDHERYTFILQFAMMLADIFITNTYMDNVYSLRAAAYIILC